MVKTPKPRLFNFWGFNTQGDFGPYTFYTSARGKLVFFLRAPPKQAPSVWQLNQRARWKAIADLWSSTTADVRSNWEAATQQLNLNLTGYNLFIWYHCHRDRDTIRTIERQTGITLL